MDTFIDNAFSSIDTITYTDILVLFDHKGPEIEFLNSQSIDEGLVLEDFHLTVKGGINDDKKRECVRGIIRIWNEPKERILEL